jgi:hypothetical protein
VLPRPDPHHISREGGGHSFLEKKTWPPMMTPHGSVPVIVSFMPKLDAGNDGDEAIISLEGHAVHAEVHAEYRTSMPPKLKTLLFLRPSVHSAAPSVSSGRFWKTNEPFPIRVPPSSIGNKFLDCEHPFCVKRMP